MDRPVPLPDATAAPYWTRAREGVFAMPRCQACGRWHFYPRSICPHCRSERLEWTQASGRGTLYSYSVVHRPPSPAFKADVPYTIGIIATDEGPHLMSRVIGIPANALRIGQRLRVKFEQHGEGVVLPVFEPDDGDGSERIIR